MINNPTKQVSGPFVIKYQKIFSYIFLLIGVYLFFNIGNETWDIIKSSIADAYIQVTSFVAGTLLFFYSLEKYLKIDLEKVLNKRPKLEIFVSSFLGALPGCGGAIIVLTQYSRGKVSFGSVVATLTATMGDAAFLLIAKEPKIGLFIMLIAFFVGFVSGILVNLIHKKNFMKMNGCDVIKLNSKPSKYKTSKSLDFIWIVLIIPGIFFGVLTAFQIDLDLYFANNFASEVSLIHRSQKFRAHLDSVQQAMTMAENGKINLLLDSEVVGLSGDETLNEVTIKSKNNQISSIKTDFWLPLFGLTPKLGPIANWGLEIEKNAIVVDNATDYSTNIDGIYAIGDVNTYPGKLKLILCGFHEGTIMVQSAFKKIHPNKNNVLKYTTVSGVTGFD